MVFVSRVVPIFCVVVLLLTVGCSRVTADPDVRGQAAAQAMPDQEVTFASRGRVRLAGALMMPPQPRPARVPGVLLIAGSGPTDRDGNQAGLRTDLLKQIAARLAQAGIATLRYDKRVAGASKREVKPNEWPEFAKWERFVDDAVAALMFLQKQPGIDAARTGMLGHSEGGLLTLQAARDLADAHNAALPRPPAVLVLASTPGRHFNDVLHEQIANMLQRQGATAEQSKYFLDKNDSITAALRRTGVVPADVPPGLAPLYPAYLGKFYHSALALDPPDLAARFNGPVLVLQGEKDIQVRAAADAPALDAGLKRRPHDDHELFVIPGASHNFKVVKDAADAGFEGDVAPAALDKLATWLQAKLVAAPPVAATR